MSTADTPKIMSMHHGLHRDVPHEVYQERVHGMASKGALDRLHKSPAHLLAWMQGKLDEPEREPLVFGGALHCALLEPEAEFDRRFALMPSFDEFRDARGALTTKAGKEAKAAFLGKSDGKQILDGDDVMNIGAMIASVRKHPLASRMIQDGMPEVTVRWRDVETGIECKARADYYVASRKMVVDVKSTRDASRREFQRSVVNYRYHVQDAIYRAAFGAVNLPIEHFVFVCVEKTPPFAVATYTLDAQAIQRGYTAYRLDIERLAECLRNDSWPAYPETIQTLDLPPWAA